MYGSMLVQYPHASEPVKAQARRVRIPEQIVCDPIRFVEKKNSLLVKIKKKRVITWMTINEIYRHIVLPN